MRKYIIVLLVVAMLFSLTSCDKKNEDKDLAKEVKKEEVKKEEVQVDLRGDESSKISDFGIRVLKNARKGGENTLISPVSIVTTMGMTANGASGKTLEEIETVIALQSDEVNNYIDKYNSTKNENVKSFNSIWFIDKKNFTMKDNFLKKVKSHYDYSLFKKPFDDSTKNDINKWVEEKTDGHIKELIDEIPNNVVVYLLNAFTFEAEWEEKYDDNHISNGKFTNAKGEVKTVEFLDAIDYKYIELDNAVGVIKNYNDKKHAFVAILPNEGVTLGDFIDGMNGDKLNAILEGVQQVEVETKIPKFEVKYGIELKPVLKEMGVKEAFLTSADFKKMAEYDEPLFINRFFHKTYINLNEHGTKAGVTTAVEMSKGEAEELEKKVYFNRPFLYLIIDKKDHLPLFIGTVEDF